MLDMIREMDRAGVTSQDGLYFVQLKNGCNFVYHPNDFHLEEVLFQQDFNPSNPVFMKPANIRKINGLNLTVEPLYPHHTMIVLTDKEDGYQYAFGLFTELSIQIEKMVNKNPFRFQTEYSSMLFPHDFVDPIPTTRWIRFSRLKKSTSLTAVSELTMLQDKKVWNPIAVMSDRTAEILKMEILVMGADLAFEGDEGGYHFTEYCVDIETCQYILNHSSFLNPKAYSI